ncbi:MAG: putative manganese transporter [Clostridia bacterium]
MLEIILDTLIDSLKMLPFLFISYLIIEFIEHKSSEKINNALSKSGKFGAVVGSLLGCFPQCGFSVTAANLYAGRVITIGTLIAVFVSTSDEAIPVLLSSPGNWPTLLKIILIKVIIAVIVGVLIDFFIRKKHTKKEILQDSNKHLKDMCKHSNCHCDTEEGILKPALKHTFNIFVFILIVAFILNCIIAFIGQDRLSTLLLSGSIFQPVIAGLIGLIPNCAASVLLTQLFLEGSISFASVIAGLCTGAGIGMAVLFKVNNNLKENLKILVGVYIIGVAAGIILQLIGI